MPINPQACKAIDDTLAALGPAVASLQDRKDYARKDAPFNVPDAVSFFQGYQQALQVCRAKDDQGGAATLAEQTGKTVIPKIQDIVSSNLTLSKMGQLNTQRTIEPETALAQNVLLGKLLQASMAFVASAQAKQAVIATATLAIRSITYTNRHGGGAKLLRPDGVSLYLRADGQFIQTHLDDSGGFFNATEWDIGRGGDGHDEPFSQTGGAQPRVRIVCRVTAAGGNVTVNGFAGQLDGTALMHNGAAMLNNNFTVALAAAAPMAPVVVVGGAHVDFTVDLDGTANFPNEIGAATLALTLTANTSAGNPTDTAHAAGTVYLTFGAPGGAAQSLAANSFTLGGNPQHVTPARLLLAIWAARAGMAWVVLGPAAATNWVDAIFLFLKHVAGVQFSLNYRWLPAVNNTGLWLKPPLHTYLWMSLSPTPGIHSPGTLPDTEAWAECHNLAVAFALMGEILGLTPFVVNFGAGNRLGYATDYPLPRRQDVAPFLAAVPAAHGRLNQPYQRPRVAPDGTVGRQQLGFVDQNGGRNNFEGVTVFNNVRLYPLGECILAQNNRGANADNYYCSYGVLPDYVISPNVPVNFDATRGLAPLFFAGEWIHWFFNHGVWQWNWQNGYDPNPYPGLAIGADFMWED
ncbi:MAG TPA: hypothetical protein VF816_14620 [Rhodocyclaceae bacterium]